MFFLRTGAALRKKTKQQQKKNDAVVEVGHARLGGRIDKLFFADFVCLKESVVFAWGKASHRDRVRDILRARGRKKRGKEQRKKKE